MPRRCANGAVNTRLGFLFRCPSWVSVNHAVFIFLLAVFLMQVAAAFCDQHGISRDNVPSLIKSLQVKAQQEAAEVAARAAAAGAWCSIMI